MPWIFKCTQTANKLGALLLWNDIPVCGLERLSFFQYLFSCICIVHLFIHSFIKYLLIADLRPDTMLGTWYTVLRETGMAVASGEILFSWKDPESHLVYTDINKLGKTLRYKQSAVVHKNVTGWWWTQRPRKRIWRLWNYPCKEPWYCR